MILSTPGDEHAQTVLAELQKIGVRAQLLNLAEFPQNLKLSLAYEKDIRRFRFGCGESGVDIGDYGAVWWRRPQQPEISSRLLRSSHRNFAMSECLEALQGLWQCLDVFWMNDPVRDQVAQRKAYQLRVAQEAGLEIPDTLITNCPGDVVDFAALRGSGRIIYKAFSATMEEWRETRLLKDEELPYLDNVKYAPVIFQEYIEAEVDLRVTVVGDEIFPAAIYSQESSYKVDFRMDWGRTRVRAFPLPAAVEEKLRAFMDRLGLVYGAIDMRLTPDGRYVFLEINPAGQWLFIEQRTEQPITAALVRVLYEGDRGSGKR